MVLNQGAKAPQNAMRSFEGWDLLRYKINRCEEISADSGSSSYLPTYYPPPLQREKHCNKCIYFLKWGPDQFIKIMEGYLQSKKAENDWRKFLDLDFWLWLTIPGANSKYSGARNSMRNVLEFGVFSFQDILKIIIFILIWNTFFNVSISHCEIACNSNPAMKWKYCKLMWTRFLSYVTGRITTKCPFLYH